MLSYESKYWSDGKNNVAGIDEAGRGPLAGPVVAAAVIFPTEISLPEVNDSKKISEQKREKLFDVIIDSALAIGIGICHERTIDKKNILQATFESMRQSIGKLSINPDILLIDGNKADIKHYEQESIINGDQKSLSTAAASIIAKVTRDRIMRKYDIVFPEYGFAKHKGYGTVKHIEAISNYKASPIHRQSFKPVFSHLPDFAYLRRNHLLNKLGCQLLACEYIKKDYEILDMNYKGLLDEIDLVSKFNGKIIFTEVAVFEFDKNNLFMESKLRKCNYEKLINDIEEYMNQNKLNCNYCFQRATVTLNRGAPTINIKELNIKEN